jgi:hypothetical protein
MQGRERRISPRKECLVPLRFRIVLNGYGNDPSQTAAPGDPMRKKSYAGTFEGKTVNLSERGIYFTSPESLSIGQPLEMYFTIPRELTGRSSEHVRCSARVVHVEDHPDKHGMLGIGAAVDRFEPVPTRDWGN